MTYGGAKSDFMLKIVWKLGNTVEPQTTLAQAIRADILTILAATLLHRRINFYSRAEDETFQHKLLPLCRSNNAHPPHPTLSFEREEDINKISYCFL